MIDLIAHGQVLGEWDGKLWIEIPSESFVKKCEETIRQQPGKYSPL